VRDPAAVEVGGQRDEAFGGEPVRDVTDVVRQAPPLLDDDDTRPLAGRGQGQIAMGFSAC
jgi:hypothetical protein